MNHQPNRMERPNITTMTVIGIRMEHPETPIEDAVLTVNSSSCEGRGVRLYGSAMVDGVLCWYHPETDLLVPARRWEEFIEKLREELDMLKPETKED